MSKIYIASSWKCERHNYLALDLESRGHTIYDYRHPPNRRPLKKTLFEHPDFPARALSALADEQKAILECDYIIAIYPFGHSVSAELGYAMAAHKECLIYAPDAIPKFDLWFLTIPIFDASPKLIEYLKFSQLPPFPLPKE